MTSAARTTSPRRGRRNAGELFLAGIIALSAIASIFLILSDSPRMLRLGILLAVWSALLGAFAMTKFRRESAADKAKARDLQTVYELQLEREIAARREYELSVEQRVRQEVGADASQIAGLRQELAALRSSLEALFEGGLPVERVALRADATRVQELDRGPYASYQPAPSGLFIPESSGGPRLASPYDDPVTAETSIIAAAAAEPEPEPVAGPEPEPVAEPEPEPVPVVAAEPAAEIELEPEPVAEADAEPLPEPAAGSRRRRRAAEAESDDGTGSHSSGGLSVADLMAKFQSESAASADQGSHRSGN